MKLKCSQYETFMLGEQSTGGTNNHTNHIGKAARISRKMKLFIITLFGLTIFGKWYQSQHNQPQYRP
jgi:hypothetical protein